MQARCQKQITRIPAGLPPGGRIDPANFAGFACTLGNFCPNGTIPVLRRSVRKLPKTLINLIENKG